MNFSLLVHAQVNNGHNLRGKVLDAERNEPVPYATIQISKDSVPINFVVGTISADNGEFHIKTTLEERCYLWISYVGKKTLRRMVKLNSSSAVNVGNLLLADDVNVLADVAITGVKPLVRVDADKLIYDVSNDQEAKISQALDVVQKLPFAVVDDGSIQINGASPTLFINGRQLKLSGTDIYKKLKGLKADNIDRIEIISSAKTKYDGSVGGPIMNVVLKKKEVGYSLGTDVSADLTGSSEVGADVTLSTKQFSISGHYSFMNGEGYKVREERSLENYTSTEKRFFNQNRRMHTELDLTNMAYLELAYEVDSMNSFSAYLDYYGARNNAMSQQSNVMLSVVGEQVFSYQNREKNKSDWGNLHVGADYQHLFNTKSKILCSYLYLRSPDKRQDTFVLENMVNYQDSNYFDRVNAVNNEHAFQFDYSNNISSNHTLEAGLKYLYRDNGSDQENYYALNDENWRLHKLNSASQYEHILAVYSEYGYEKDSWQMVLGLRGERTFFRLKYGSPNDVVRNYYTLLPSLSLSYKLKNSNNLTLGYNSSLIRPGIGYLNPTVYRLDQGNILFGNDRLEAEVTHNLLLQFSKFAGNNQYAFSAGYSFCGNPIQSYSGVNKEGVYYTTYVNAGYLRAALVSFYMKLPLASFARLVLNASGSYSALRSSEEANDGVAGNISSNLFINLPCNFSLSVAGLFKLPDITLQGKSFNFYSCKMRLSKSFLDDNLAVSLNLDNVFWDYKKYKLREENKFYRRKTDLHCRAMNIGLSLSYSFGKSASTKSVHKGIEEETVKGARMEGGN